MTVREFIEDLKRFNQNTDVAIKDEYGQSVYDIEVRAKEYNTVVIDRE